MHKPLILSKSTYPDGDGNADLPSELESRTIGNFLSTNSTQKPCKRLKGEHSTFSSANQNGKVFTNIDQQKTLEHLYHLKFAKVNNKCTLMSPKLIERSRNVQFSPIIPKYKGSKVSFNLIS